MAKYSRQAFNNRPIRLHSLKTYVCMTNHNVKIVIYMIGVRFVFCVRGCVLAYMRNQSVLVVAFGCRDGRRIGRLAFAHHLCIVDSVGRLIRFRMLLLFLLLLLLLLGGIPGRLVAERVRDQRDQLMMQKVIPLETECQLLYNTKRVKLLCRKNF